MFVNDYCQLCGSPFGTQFTKGVFKVGSKKICESCWWDLFLNRADSHCSHCGIFFDAGGKGTQNGRLFYCEICAKEMEERSKTETIPIYDIFKKYENLRKERDK